MSDVLVLSNIDTDKDITFDSDIGVWNISRALRDCNAGKHQLWGFDVDELYKAIGGVEVEQKKVLEFARKYRSVLDSPPIILIIEHGKVYVIDGHHRIHAHKRIGVKKIVGFVIEEEVSAPYIVWFNGRRLPPWKYENDSKNL